MTMPNDGIPARAIARMLARLEAGGVCMHGFILAQQGQTLAEGYWAPFRAGVPHRMFSVSKSMVSLAIGLLEAEGKLRLTDAICGYFPDMLPQTVPGELARVTIRDMLCMAACHRRAAFRQTDDPNWTRAFFTVRPTHEPGTVFHYNTSASHTLAALAQRLSGMPLLEFLQARLWNAVGATDAKRWLTDPVGMPQGGSGLVMSLRDLAKVAQLCLEGGRGTPLENYLPRAVRWQIATPLQEHDEEKFGYGYQFWRVRNNGFAMYGVGGQLAVCLPDTQTVFCTVADTQMDPNGVQKIYDAFWAEAYPLISGGEPSTQGDWDALREKTQTLAMRPVPDNAAYAVPAGGEYRFAENPAGITVLRLGERELAVENASGRYTLPFGVGAWAASIFPGTQEPCIASAGWTAPALLRFTCHLTGDLPAGLDLLLCFKGDRVTMQMKSVREILQKGYTGVVSGTSV